MCRNIISWVILNVLLKSESVQGNGEFPNVGTTSRIQAGGIRTIYYREKLFWSLSVYCEQTIKRIYVIVNGACILMQGRSSPYPRGRSQLFLLLKGVVLIIPLY